MARQETDKKRKVVIVGGGFGGLYCAKGLESADLDVTLVDKRNFHLFQPLLYQVATGGLSPGDIAAPLREILKRQKNTRVLLSEVVDFDPDRREVVLREGRLQYDTLVVAAGASNHYFGNDDWSRVAPGLKSLEDATEMRRRVLLAFEKAEGETDRHKRESLLTFVVVGGGPTGVELAGPLAELARDTLRRDFRSIDPAESRIFLLEGSDRVLPAFDEGLSERAARDLRRLRVHVRTDTFVRHVEEGSVVIATSEREETIRAQTVLWAAGVRASPLARTLAKAAGTATDHGGRIRVTPGLNIPDHPEVFVVGDMALAEGPDGAPLPGVAPVAMQQGSYVATTIRGRLRGEPARPFRYLDKGKLATIGRALAVAEIGRFRFGGLFAWITWLLVHLLYLVGFENRLLVLVQWAWNYLTWNRSARLITYPPASKHTPRDSRTVPSGRAEAVCRARRPEGAATVRE